MVTLTELRNYTDGLLRVTEYQDYCPNGLQVEGSPDIQRLISGVTASHELIQAAIEFEADALLVHHGFFWKGETPCITGMKRRRIQGLLTHGISLLAYHLPLDAHPELGNNAQLALQLGFDVQGSFRMAAGPDLAMRGVLRSSMTGAELAIHIQKSLDREPLHVAGGPEKITKIGWCTGAAQSYIEAAAEQGLDAFISGEISEPTVHAARELGIHYFAAGHHATERYGAKALGRHLAERFGLEHRFIDIDNPV